MRTFAVTIGVLLLVTPLFAGEGDLEGLRRRFKEVAAEARKAKEGGDRGRAEKLGQEMKEIESQIARMAGKERGAPERERMAGIEKLRRQAADLEAKLREMREKLPDGSEKVKEVRKQLDLVREQLKKIEGERGGPERPRVKEAEKIKARLGELEANIREAKEKGQGDRAEKLSREADELRGRLKELMGEGERPGPERPRVKEAEKIKARLGELEANIREAKEKGQGDRAEKLSREAKELRMQLDRLMGEGKRRGPGDEEVRGIKEKIMAVRREAEEAAKRGEKERAEELFRKAKDIERDLVERRGGGREGGGPEDVIHRIAQLRVEAIGAKRDGDPRHAMELWAEANRMEAELARATGIGPAPREGIQPGEGRPMGEVQGEIERLRQEVRQLREILDKALRERPRPEGDRERPDRERREGERREGDRGEGGERLLNLF
jgi:hypothetical protein